MSSDYHLHLKQVAMAAATDHWRLEGHRLGSQQSYVVQIRYHLRMSHSLLSLQLISRYLGQFHDIIIATDHQDYYECLKELHCVPVSPLAVDSTFVQVAVITVPQHCGEEALHSVKEFQHQLSQYISTNGLHFSNTIYQQ